MRLNQKSANVGKGELSQLIELGVREGRHSLERMTFPRQSAEALLGTVASDCISKEASSSF